MSSCATEILIIMIINSVYLIWVACKEKTKETLNKENRIAIFCENESMTIVILPKGLDLKTVNNGMYLNTINLFLVKMLPQNVLVSS